MFIWIQQQNIQQKTVNYKNKNYPNQLDIGKVVSNKMKKFSYQAFLKGEAIAPPQSKYEKRVSQNTTRQKTIVSNHSSINKIEQAIKTKLFFRMLLRITLAKQHFVFKRIQKAQKSKQINLALIEKLSQRLLLAGFLEILSTSKKNSTKKDTISVFKTDSYAKTTLVKKNISRLIFFKLVVMAQKQMVNGLLQIKLETINSRRKQRFLLQFQSIGNRLEKNLTHIAWNKLKTMIYKLLLKQKVMRSICRILPIFLNKAKSQVFKDFVKRTQFRQFQETISDKAMTIKHANQYHSSRVKRLSHQKQLLRQIKNNLESQSSLKNKALIETNKSRAALKAQLKQVQKKYNQQLQLSSSKSGGYQNYLGQLNLILNQRKQSEIKSKGMEKRMRQASAKIEQMQKGFLNNMGIIPKNIQSQKIYHLYLNQKLRSLIMLYERGNSHFQNWAEDQKISRENHSLKLIIAGTLSNVYQKDWAINLSKTI